MGKSKYDGLGQYLSGSQEQVETLSYDEIEQILGDKLPQSAYKLRQWWENTNERHSQANSWLNAGWKVSSVELERSITFKKVRKKRLSTPVAEEEIKELQAGDIVYLSGEVYTARDRAHHRIIEYESTDAETEVPIEKGAILYHCGPLMKKSNGEWEIIAAGPTTSSRMEATTPEVIEKLQIRGIIGKGGMGTATRAALQKYGCVYFAMTGGAAVLAAARIKAVKAVYWADLGMAEAVWHLQVEDFGPLVVSMDASGKSLYEAITEEAQKNVLQ